MATYGPPAVERSRARREGCASLTEEDYMITVGCETTVISANPRQHIDPYTFDLE